MEEALVDSPEHVFVGGTEKMGVEDEAREVLQNHSFFRGRTGCVSIEYRDGVLVLHGKLSSFYLKQVLQTVLKDLVGVERIDNRVSVVCCDGLSSVRADDD